MPRRIWSWEYVVDALSTIESTINSQQSTARGDISRPESISGSCKHSMVAIHVKDVDMAIRMYAFAVASAAQLSIRSSDLRITVRQSQSQQPPHGHEALECTYLSVARL